MTESKVLLRPQKGQQEAFVNAEEEIVIYGGARHKWSHIKKPI